MTDRLEALLMEDVPNRTFLKPTEVATLLRVSTKTIYRWCDIGLIESVKMNGSVRVLRESVANLLSAEEP